MRTGLPAAPAAARRAGPRAAPPPHAATRTLRHLPRMLTRSTKRTLTSPWLLLKTRTLKLQMAQTPSLMMRTEHPTEAACGSLPTPCLALSACSYATLGRCMLIAWLSNSVCPGYKSQVGCSKVVRIGIRTVGGTGCFKADTDGSSGSLFGPARGGHCAFPLTLQVPMMFAYTP